MEIKHSQDSGKGKFDLMDDSNKAAEITYVIDDQGDLIVNHTYVRHHYRDRGLGLKLLDHVVSYVRENGLKIVPKCPFVKSVFSESDKYDDIWKK